MLNVVGMLTDLSTSIRPTRNNLKQGPAFIGAASEVLRWAAEYSSEFVNELCWRECLIFALTGLKISQMQIQHLKLTRCSMVQCSCMRLSFVSYWLRHHLSRGWFRI